MRHSAWRHLIPSVVYAVSRNRVHYAQCLYSEWLSAEYRYAKCHYAEFSHAECRYDKCRYAECHYAECRGSSIIVLTHKMTLNLETEAFKHLNFQRFVL